MTRSALSAWAEDHDVELLFFDPPEYFDHAILGVVTGFGQEPAVLYDEARVLAAMAEDMGWDDAREWFDFNTIGAYLGPATPRFLQVAERKAVTRRAKPATVVAMTKRLPSLPPRPPGFTAYMRALGAKGGRIGGTRRLETMTPRQRTDVARKAAQARWNKKKIAAP